MSKPKRRPRVRKHSIRLPEPPCSPEPPRPPDPVSPDKPGCDTGPDPTELLKELKDLVKKRKR
jgi:hypothetical protein